MHHLMLVVALLSATPSLAQDVDHSLQLEKDVARNAWAAADRSYESLLDEGKPSARDHLLAGRAARALGRVTEARDRFEASLKAEPSAEAEEELAAIAAEYGEVSLKIGKRHEGAVPLAPRTPMVDAVHRLVVEEAKKALAETGSYRGLLPIGGYRLGADTTFEVTREAAVKAKL